VNYQQAHPGERLSRHVECFWTLEGVPGAGEAPQCILPDGSMELVFHYGDPFRRFLPGGGSEIQPRTLVAGQLLGEVRLQPTGWAGCFGIRFRPGGAWPFLACPVDELTGSILDLSLLQGREARELAQRITEAPDWPSRCEAARRWLLERLSPAPQDRAVEYAVQAIQASHGTVSVSALAGGLGLSRRSLERRFRRRVGLLPKQLARVLRFQRALQLRAVATPGGWPAIALECGYYDQAHLIRDFRQFSGQTPAAFRGEEMTGYFVRAPE
jgi:AraC-like DNA-binding protein